jgi:hypothetical protein
MPSAVVTRQTGGAVQNRIKLMGYAVDIGG